MQVDLLVRDGADKLVTTLIIDVAQDTAITASKFLGKNISIMAINAHGSEVNSAVRKVFEDHVMRKQIVGIELANLANKFDFGLAINVADSLVVVQTAKALVVPTFTTGAITNAAIVLNWTAVSGTTAYIVERATEPTFASPTAVYSGTNLTVSAATLAASTTYYFRIKVRKTSYLDSSYKYITAATIA